MIPEAAQHNFDLLITSTWCSKHVEAWNKLTVKQKFCASSWLITKINSVYLVTWIWNFNYQPAQRHTLHTYLFQDFVWCRYAHSPHKLVTKVKLYIYIYIYAWIESLLCLIWIIDGKILVSMWDMRGQIYLKKAKCAVQELFNFQPQDLS